MPPPELVLTPQLRSRCPPLPPEGLWGENPPSLQTERGAGCMVGVAATPKSRATDPAPQFWVRLRGAWVLGRPQACLPPHTHHILV